MRLFRALLLLGTLAPVAQSSTAAGPTCRSSEHGAAPSATRYATAALQAAIDACSGSCGTAVVDVPGAYLTASLQLSGCVSLHIPAGVTLLAGSRRADYGPSQPDWYLLLFRNCTGGCRLSGTGTVDGRARLWVQPAGGSGNQTPQAAPRQTAGLATAPDAPRRAVRNWADPSCPKPEECRPRLVGVLDSAKVSITGISLTDAVYWTLHVLRSQAVHISGVRIRSDWGIPNTDGIDVDSSSHVSIRRVDVATADDAICLKTTVPGRPLQHVAVTDSRLRSRSSAVKLGSESVADMRHLRFARLAIVDSHRGLAIQLRDGGNISDVRFDRIRLSTRHYGASWWGAAEPISVTAVPRTAATRVGTVADVTFSRISAVAENGIFLSGGPMASQAGGTGPSGAATASSRAAGAQQQALVQPPWQQLQRRHSLQGISLHSVSLHLLRRSAFAGGCQDWRPSSNDTAPSSGGWWPAGLDCSSGSTAAVWIAGADDVTLSHVQVRYGCPRRPDWRQQLAIDAASALSVRQADVRISSDDCEEFAATVA